MLERANEGLDKLKNKAEIMGEALDRQEGAVQELHKEVDKAREGLENANARLKKVLFSVNFFTSVLGFSFSIDSLPSFV